MRVATTLTTSDWIVLSGVVVLLAVFRSIVLIVDATPAMMVAPAVAHEERHLRVK